MKRIVQSIARVAKSINRRTSIFGGRSCSMRIDRKKETSKMKHLGLCILTLGFAATTYGSPTSCSSLTNLQQYINANVCTFTSNGQNYTLQDFTFANVSLLTPAIGAANFEIGRAHV